jgi:hypothetical protein
MRTLCNGWRSSASVAALAALTAVLLTACTEAPTRTEAASRATAVQSPWAAPTSTVRWNEYACELIARNQAGQFPALRTLAYLNVAINNAIVTARAKGVAPEGAAAGAAASILAFLFPKDEATINARLATETNSLGATSYRPNFTSGVEIGRAAAADVVAMAKMDRSAVAWTGTVPTGEDKWSSRSQPPAAPLGPHFGSMRTFFMTNGAEFRSPPPPGIGSPAFKATLTEVRTISDGRT